MPVLHPWGYYAALVSVVIHEHHSWIDCWLLPSLGNLLGTAGITKASSQVWSSSGLQGPMSKEHDVSCNRDLFSVFRGNQSSSNSLWCFENLLDNPEQHLKKRLLMPGFNALFCFFFFKIIYGSWGKHCHPRYLSPCTKSNPKWLQNLNVKNETTRRKYRHYLTGHR